MAVKTSSRLLLVIARILNGGSLPLHAKKKDTDTRALSTRHRRLVFRWLVVVAIVSGILFVSTRQFLPSSRTSLESAYPRGFISYSSYRIGADRFAAVGLGALRARGSTRFHSCHWRNHGSSSHDPGIPGVLKAFYPGEHHDLEYEAVVVHCLLRHATSAFHPGGTLTFHIDDRQLSVYSEAKGAFAAALEPRPPFRHRVAFCSPPLYGAVDVQRMYEWLEYHYHAGIDYAIVYDAGGIDDPVGELLLQYERKGLLEVRDMSHFAHFDTWLYAQVMAINDCAYSTRYTAKWAYFADFDEFFNADDPPPAAELQQRHRQLIATLNAAEQWHRQLSRLRQRHLKDMQAAPRREREEEEGGEGGGGGVGGGGGAAEILVPEGAGQGSVGGKMVQEKAREGIAAAGGRSEAWGAGDPSKTQGTEPRLTAAKAAKQRVQVGTVPWDAQVQEEWGAESWAWRSAEERREEEEEEVELEGGRGVINPKPWADRSGSVEAKRVGHGGTPHDSRVWLSRRGWGEGSADRVGVREAERVEEARRRMRAQYQALSRRRRERREAVSEEEQQRRLAAQVAEQQNQLEVIRAYRDHMRRMARDQRLIPLVLDSYDGAAFLTFGTLWWSVERCTPEMYASGPWGVQRMIYHWPHIYCQNPEVYPRAEMCLDYHGHRKYAVNPRLVTTLQIHRIERNESYGYDLDTTVAKLNHYQGYIERAKVANSCTEIMPHSELLVWWARGDEIGNLAAAAQKKPVVRPMSVLHEEMLR